MTIDIRRARPGEWDAIIANDEYGFHFRATPERREEVPGLLDIERFSVAVDDTDGEVVGVAGSLTTGMTRPGGTEVPVSAVTWVAVRPTHRRRGILSGLMADQDRVAAERHEVALVLFASESTIYGRFGYGIAAQQRRLTVESRRIQFRDPGPVDGRVSLLESAAAAPLCRQAFERARLLRAGNIERGDAWWDRFAKSPEHIRDDHERLFHVVHEDGHGEVDGFVVYGMKHDWSDGLPANRLEVLDFQAASPAAHAALWRFLAGVDLVGEISTWYCPVDDPLPWMVTDARRVRSVAVNDNLWVKPWDAVGLLDGRATDGIGSVVLDVAGVGVLQVSGDGKTLSVEAGAARRADLSMGASELGSISLGGFSPRLLARAGRIAEHVDGALVQAEQLLAADPLPFCSTPF